MGIEVDFDGVEAATGFEPLPEGTYVCVVKDAEEKTASTGTPGFGLTFEIVGPPEWKGRELWDNLWISQKSLPFVRQKVEALGVPIPSGPFMLQPEALVGRPVRLVVRHEEYQDSRDGSMKTASRVRAWEPSAGSSGNGLPADPIAHKPSHDDDIPF